MYKDRENKAKKLLKTKEVSFEANPKPADLEFQTSVSNNCFNRLYESCAHRPFSKGGADIDFNVYATQATVMRTTPLLS